MTEFMKSVSKLRGWLMLVVAFITTLLDRWSKSMSSQTTSIVEPLTLPVVPAPSVEFLEELRLSDIARRSAERRAKRREKLAARAAEQVASPVESTVVVAPIAAVERPMLMITDQVLVNRTLITTSCTEGNKALATLTDESLKSAEASIATAKAAYEALKAHPSKPDLTGTFRPIKDLERAFARCHKQLDEEKAKSVALEAETVRQEAAKIESARKVEEDKRAVRENCKLASNNYRGMLDKIGMFIEDGEATMARAELENARSERKAANAVREQYNLLWGEGKKKPFPNSDLKDLEEQLNDLETLLAAEQAAQTKLEEQQAAKQAKSDESRAWLSTFFGIAIDEYFCVTVDDEQEYKPKPAPSHRCAVCLAQAKRLIEELGLEQLIPLANAMQVHLLNGLKMFKQVQLCNPVGQALDEAGKLYGHRFFNRRLQLVAKHLNEETGEVTGIDTLESNMAKAMKQPDIEQMFEAFKHDQVVTASRKPPKAFKPRVQLAA